MTKEEGIQDDDGGVVLRTVVGVWAVGPPAAALQPLVSEQTCITNAVWAAILPFCARGFAFCPLFY